MPPRIRAILSFLVIIASAILWTFRAEIAMEASPFVFFGLSAGLVGALWMFPEIKKGTRDT